MQQLWKKSLIFAEVTIKEAIRTLDVNSFKILLVVDKDYRLLGTVTDGDIRRGILKNCKLDGNIKSIANLDPVVANTNLTYQEKLKLVKSRKILYLPIVDDNNHILGLEEFEYPYKILPSSVPVVIMAGGLATRLRPITENCPKPLLQIGGKPILETIICTLRDHGYRKFYISVNYKAEMITNYFSDGEHLGVNISYLHEKKAKGTAGALKLLPKLADTPLLVMNGDVLTNVDYYRLLTEHLEQQAEVSVCVKEYDFQVPYGVLNLDKTRIIKIEEKPIQSFFINAGIYMIDSKCLSLIPHSERYDMTEFLQKILNGNKKCIAFPIREYWLDIGQINDYHRAHNDYKEIFE